MNQGADVTGVVAWGLRRYAWVIALFVVVLLAKTVRRARPAGRRLAEFDPTPWLIGGGLACNGLTIGRYVYDAGLLGAAAGLEDRESYLGRRIPSYPMFSHINGHLPDQAKIFFVYMKNKGFLCDRAYYSDSMFESYTLQKILSRSSAPEDVSGELKAKGFTHLLCDMDFIFGPWSLMSAKEKEMFSRFVSRHCSLVKQDKSYFLFQIN